jgi:hypothetical protein
MERLGHCDDETTKNVYLHVTKEMKKEASHKFAQLMRSLSSGEKGKALILVKVFSNLF